MSDNGCEFVLNEFKNFYANEGIRQELTTLHNPQQNGVVKRNNHSTVGAVREMSHDQVLPLHLWVDMITPKEAFLGRNLVVSHFKIFGASVYYHVSKESRKMIEPTT